jgi:hypothetical protein
VSIDKSGRVNSAKALNGHPLLKMAAERAAQGASFEASDVDSREARLTYVFVPDGEKANEGNVRYTNPYRIEIVNEPVIINNTIEHVFAEKR